MAPFAVLEGVVLSIWATLIRAEYPSEIFQELENRAESLRARIEDVKGETLSTKIQRRKKRKREDDLQHWVTKAGLLLEEVEHVLRGVGGDRNFLTCAKMRKIADKKIEALVDHEEKLSGVASRYNLLLNAQGPSHGTYIPVKELIGQVASANLERLQALLLDARVGRIAIYGVEGIGKTFLMKHLHNCALDWVQRFDYVFWVTLSHQFSIMHVQDAVAAAVMCDISYTDDLFLRAQKLSHTLAGLGRVVLFLDAVPEARFSLEEVGIPVPTEGSMCKVVLTTNSALACEMLDCFAKIKLDPLPEAEACQLFMHEAGLGIRSASRINEIAVALARECCGVPRTIVNVATRMYGVDDIHEWRNALFELRNLGKKDKLSFQVSINELKHSSEVVKKDVLICSLPSVE